ncbi:MAG: hypothetical protein HRU17_22210 [Polyangiaceae bacterium]|nr:hypothetical protein [Polyangiaceae bacterium]
MKVDSNGLAKSDEVDLVDMTGLVLAPVRRSLGVDVGVINSDALRCLARTGREGRY